MIRVLVDSGAWFAASGKRDPNYSEVAEALRRWEGRLVTHTYIFDEVVTLAKSRDGHAVAIRIGELLRDPAIVDLVRVTAEDEEVAWESYRRDEDKGYSFTDCVSFAVMRRLGIDRAITLDRDFRRAGFQSEPEWPSGWHVSEEAQPFGLATGRTLSRAAAPRRPPAASPSSTRRGPRSGRARS